MFTSLRIWLAATILSFSLVCAHAQQTAPRPQSPAGDLPAAPSQEKQTERQEQSQRILGVVPQFGVTSRQNAPPLSAKEKFNLFVKSAVDPFTFVAVGFQAGISQAQDEFHSYGQGAAGYGKRYGAALADSTSSGFFANFLYPTLLKDDPRYFRLADGSFKHRLVYAVEQVFVCRTDHGRRTLNLPNILGAFSTGALSNLYYPPEDRGAGLTVSRSVISVAYGSAGDLLSEFWPDIQKKLFSRNKKPRIAGK